MIKRWAQEILGYQFTVIHRNAKMMKDFEILNRFYEPEIAEFLKVAAILRSDDSKKRPDAYNRTNFSELATPTKANMGNAKNQVADPPMIITEEDIKQVQPFTTAHYVFGQENDHTSSIITSPVMVCQPAHI